MAIKAATPYLILNGRAKEAHRDLIMHAELKLGSALLMVSDGMAEGPVPADGAVKVALAFETEAELRAVFDALSAGGQVVQAPLRAPFGMFAALGDRFGVSWMLTA